MDPYVASPHWHGLITAYFFLGGIAAGSYATFTMAGLFGAESDQKAVRFAAYLAFPLVCVCGLILVVDLNRPERFWHMLIQSETFRPMFKWWSPMSAGSWGLSAFGAFSFFSFLGVLAEDRRFGLGRWSALATKLRRGPLARLFEVGGTLSAFFLGAYTGALLSATNQPVWAQTTWLAALFLASSASTGIAAILLLARGFGKNVTHDAFHRLEWLDAYAIVLELVMLAAFAWSLGPLASKVFRSWPGLLIPWFVVPAGLLLPLLTRFSRQAWTAPLAAFAVLIAGLALRYAVVGMPAGFVLER